MGGYIENAETRNTFTNGCGYAPLVEKAVQFLAVGKNMNDEIIKELLVYIGEDYADSAVNYLIRLRNTERDTYQHSINVSFYAMLACEWLGLPANETKEVVLAALFHDIGKTRVRPELLNKRGKLCAEEFDEIKKHTVYGYDIMKKTGRFSEAVNKVILTHHEREDGSGYPMGQKGSETSKYSKIVAIVDVYDAMISERIYKERATPFDAFRMFRTEGLERFDKRIMRVFTANIAPYYTGARILLNTGVCGEIVCIPAHDITKPIIYTEMEYIDTSTREDIWISRMIE